MQSEAGTRTAFALGHLINYMEEFMNLLRKAGRFVFLDMVAFFAPVIAIGRLWKKRRWNYIRQMRVLYRYSEWR